MLIKASIQLKARLHRRAVWHLNTLQIFGMKMDVKLFLFLLLLFLKCCHCFSRR